MTEKSIFDAMRVLPAILLFLLFHAGYSQPTFPVNGAPFKPHTVYAFTHANIHADDETLLKDATLVVRDNRILDCGTKVQVPAHAVVVDLKGSYIYPSFIDLFSDYGLPAPQKTERRRGRSTQMESNEKGAYGWNQAIKAHFDGQSVFTHQADKADELRKNGFGIVLCAPNDGIVRGSGPLVQLNTGSKENKSILAGRAAAFYSFNKGSSTQDYPTSLAGSIALLRQTYLDADWYATPEHEQEHNLTLDAFNRLKNLPAIFDAGDKYQALRAAMVGKEFGVNYIVKAGGNEYQRMDEIKRTGLRYILPLNFPQTYDVEDPYDAEAVSLAELKHWELAPINPAMFEKHGIPFCFTAGNSKDLKTFLSNLRKAIEFGLSEKAALRALTRNPAEFVGAGSVAGSLRKNYMASFFITDKPVFESGARILQHWVAGEPYQYSDADHADLRGKYLLTIGTRTFEVKMSGEASKPSGKITVDTNTREFTLRRERQLISFLFTEDSAKTILGSGSFQQSENRFSGNAQLPDGSWQPFVMEFQSPGDSAKQQATKSKQPPMYGDIIYPFSAFGEPLKSKASFRKDWETSRTAEIAILIKNATVWTNESEGVIAGGEVLVADGKIVAVGKTVTHAKTAGAKVIDGTGMHLTPGVIDEHSHIALTSGVNEAAQASSAEVRMGDVINADDINIYRQLSGGVTTSQLLHGSANPIGGQSVLIKLRWGLPPEDLKFENAPPFIKFALGENVKQANWGDAFTQRFPQTRMGVEQVYVDHFTRAREYEVSSASPKGTKGKSTPRRDLELEALAEILAGKRFITCHSYVQSEINMLMKVADSLGFKVNTFTHILEGYKVADKMKSHGAYASTFSDWWAYKEEVKDAIPYNAALLTKAGVITAINSDDAEMARRLNQEAAKAVKYGGLTEEEALKLVTLNPAKMLHIDHRVGSIKPGKDADLVLWSDHPLSVYARAEKTMIDGRIYFDCERDARLREYVRTERARLINKLLLEKKKGGTVVKPKAKEKRLYHCNTIEGIDEAITGHR